MSEIENVFRGVLILINENPTAGLKILVPGREDEELSLRELQGLDPHTAEITAVGVGQHIVCLAWSGMYSLVKYAVFFLIRKFRRCFVKPRFVSSWSIGPCIIIKHSFLLLFQSLELALLRGNSICISKHGRREKTERFLRWFIKCYLFLKNNISFHCKTKLNCFYFIKMSYFNDLGFTLLNVLKYLFCV
jgi:hypothetical protein